MPDPFYSSKPWRALRGRFLKAHPVCPCGAPANRVDHIVTRRRDPSRELDPTNLTALCEPCHNRKTARYDGGWGRQTVDEASLGCDVSGRPRDPTHPWNAATAAGRGT